MPLTDVGDLAIAELVFWGPTIFVSGFIASRHGFNRQNPWLFITILGVCRIISAACNIAYELETNPSSGLAEAAAITGSLGISFLLIASSGLTTKVLSTMRDVPFGSAANVPFYLGVLVGVILAIVGVVKVQNGMSDLDEYNEGYKLYKASSIILMAVLAALALLVSFILLHMQQVPTPERRFILAVLLALPFVFVRILYIVLIAFVNNSTFNLFGSSIWAQAFMQIFEEMMVALIFITVGIFARRSPERTSLEDEQEMVRK